MSVFHATAIGLNPEGRAYCLVQRDLSLPADEDLALVDGLLPGESAAVRLGRRRRGKREGRVEGPVLGSARLPPACSHAHQCGGCRTQQLPYDQELEWKQRTLVELFPNTNLQPIQGSPKRFAYRNKMEWTFAQDRQGKRFLGLHGRGLRGVIDIQQCALVNPWMSQALQVVRSWWAASGLPAYHPHKNQGLLRTLTLREGFRTGDRLASLLIHHDERDAIFEHVPALIQALKPLCHHFVLRFQVARAGQPTYFEQDVLWGSGSLKDRLCVHGYTLDLAVSPSAFMQPNPWLAEKLYGTVLDQLDPSLPTVDLFAGTGTLGLLAASLGSATVSVEINPDACLDALRNRDLNNLQALHQVHCGDAFEWLRHQSSSLQQFIVDPPRAGLGEQTCTWLVQNQPKRILYISCNPKTQRADCDQLRAGGYSLRSLQPFDQFPNTPHVEQLAILEHSG